MGRAERLGRHLDEPAARNEPHPWRGRLVEQAPRLPAQCAQSAGQLRPSLGAYPQFFSVSMINKALCTGRAAPPRAHGNARLAPFYAIDRFGRSPRTPGGADGQAQLLLWVSSMAPIEPDRDVREGSSPGSPSGSWPSGPLSSRLSWQLTAAAGTTRAAGYRLGCPFNIRPEAGCSTPISSAFPERTGGAAMARAGATSRKSAVCTWRTTEDRSGSEVLP